MKLTVVGSADAFNSAGRGNSCYLIESPGAGKLMVDFGPTALMGLRNVGFVPNEVSGIVFTHLHGDHIGGVPFLLIDALYQSFRRAPLDVLGPVRTTQTLQALLDATYGDVSDDLSRLTLTIHEASPGQNREIAGYRVACYAADHMKPPHQPLCLRIEDPLGSSIAFSGDTRFCPGLFAAAEGADLLVAECTRLEPPAGSHCTLKEWVSEFENVRASSLLLTHLGADVRDLGPSVLAKLELPLPVHWAEDGMVLSVPAKTA